MLELDRDVLERARGQWLDFEVHVSGLRGDRVTLRTTATENAAAWQAIEAELECQPGHNRLCFFVGNAISSATLEADGEWSVDWIRAEPVASPPRDARVPAGMDVVAWLHGAGLSGLHQVELTGDSEWPFAATGVDPQLRFSAPNTAGLYRVELKLELESAQDEPQPGLCWDTGEGFGVDQSRPFRRIQDGRFVVECAVEQTWRGWRLDPLAAPGRFRIGTLCMTPMVQLPSTGSAERWGTRISRSVRLLRDRVLKAHTSSDLGLDDGAFSPISDDVSPHVVDATRLRLTDQLSPGWYMLELCVAFDGARAEAHVYLEAEQGDRAFLPLPLRSGQLVKRLLYVEQPATLRLLPVAAPRAFELRHFRLARVPGRFAQARIKRKLSAKHPRYMRKTTRGTLGKDVPNDARGLWAEYNRLFERSSELVSYDEWIDVVERDACPSRKERRSAIAAWEHRPTISIIMPIDDADEVTLCACLDSVLAQTYPRWELCIADNASRAPHVRRILSDYATRDPRIRVVFREKNAPAAEASNTALLLARGDYVTFLGPHDMLAAHALFAVTRALQQRPSAELIYSDEDKLDDLGRRCDPYFKPDFARDLLYAQNYVAHLVVCRRKLVDDACGFRPGYEGSQDYDLVLRCIARIGDGRDILHVPEVLYHCRKTAGSTVTSHPNEDHGAESARRALEDHLDLAHPGVRVSVTAPGLYRVHWPLPDPAPLVTLIVPTRDGHDVLKKCVESIRQRTTYPNYEILVVDNESHCLRTRSYLDVFAEQGVRVLRYDAPFNFSAINNFAVREARGSVLGLINDDVEVINDGWLTELVSHALRPEIGCVGAKLYYPDDTIQHAGVVLGIGGVAGHSHRFLERKHDGYFGRLRIAHNVSAVTAAALVVRRQVWDEVGGFDEAELAVAFNDVDFCLRVMAAGYRNLWTPHAELYHYESKSRGSDETPEKAARFRAEREVMLRRWGPLLERDPYYSPHLSLVREDYSRALPEARRVSEWRRGAA